MVWGCPWLWVTLYTKRCLSPVGAYPVAGRLSSCDPNLQTVPRGVETCLEVDFNFRALFVPARPHTKLVAIDYSQMEIRVLALFCRDPHLQKVLQQRTGDLYLMLSSMFLKKDVQSVTPQERTQTKTLALGIIYGMGATELARRLNIPVPHAARLRRNFLGTFPGIANFMRVAVQRARKCGYVETVLGRKRSVPDITSSNNRLKAMAERQSVNSIIQGSAADVMKVALVRLRALFSTWQASHPRLPAPRILLQLHDEVLLEVTNTEPHFQPLVRSLIHCLETDVPESVFASLGGTVGSVPFRVSVKEGKDWGNMKDISSSIQSH